VTTLQHQVRALQQSRDVQDRELSRLRSEALALAKRAAERGATSSSSRAKEGGASDAADRAEQVGGGEHGGGDKWML